MKKTLNLVLAAVTTVGLAFSAHAEDYITLASTTSTEHSGLFDSILPKFEDATGIEVRVVAVGTGQAFEIARRGDADSLLVHDTAGLFVSFRAALALPDRLDLTPAAENPCNSCIAQPCRSACPVGALAPDQSYDVPACLAHIRSPEGRECRNGKRTRCRTRGVFFNACRHNSGGSS